MDGGRWKHKKEPVLIAEFKLMDRKEQKLRAAIEKDSKLVDRQREKLGMTVEALAGIEDGYYRRYVQKEPAKSSRQVKFSTRQSIGKVSQKSLVHGYSKQKTGTSMRSLVPHPSNLEHEYGSIIPASTQRRKVTYENCGSYPNTTDYIKRILDPKEYLHITSNRSQGGPDHLTDGDKSHDRRRISIDDDSAQRSDNGHGLHSVPTYSKRAGSAHYSGSHTAGRQKKAAQRATHSTRQDDEGEPEPQYLDLAEYLSEEQAMREEAELNSENGTKYLNTTKSKMKDPRKLGSQGSLGETGTPPDHESYGQMSQERPSVTRSTIVHPKQVSYENAMKLREGKIFAKFDKELKIYDLRDLDCKIGVDIHLLQRKKVDLSTR
jgi:hypothetical protein